VCLCKRRVLIRLCGFCEIGTVIFAASIDDRRQTIDTTRDLAKDTNEAFKKLSVAHADNPAVRLVARRRRTDARAQKAKLVHDRLRKDFETWLKEYQEVSKLSVQKERESQPRPDPDDAAVFKGLGAGPDAGLSSGMPGMGGHYSEQVCVCI
jgi:hypothetical protein